MNTKVVFFICSLLLIFGTTTYAHSGRTDSSGGHNCSPKSQSKGLCSGYHYHNGGNSSSEDSSSSTKKPAATRNDKDCSDFANYDETVNYWNSKGYSATNDPENLDGWGNGQVDDGIPCEAPSGYDKSKINNSPEQLQYKKEEADTKEGETLGHKQGLKDGYAEANASDTTSEGSVAFKSGYSSGYSKGYKEGKQKISTEKTKATNEGYASGQKQDKINIPKAYLKHPGLNESYQNGFNKALTERTVAQKKKYNDLGYMDGLEDNYSLPKNVQDSFKNSYQEGYDQAIEELKIKYIDMGYEAAFTMLKFKNPNLSNDKYKQWYKEGYESNDEVQEIKNAGYHLGKTGEEYSIPSESKKGEVIFEHFYKKGYKQYNKEQKQNQATAAGAIGLATITWLGRRLYIAKKMIR